MFSWVGAYMLATVLGGGGGTSPSPQQLEQRAKQLAEEARALANPRGCTEVSQCDLAPFGHKPCGGPREYIAFCTTSTDRAMLEAKLQELEKAEAEWQAAAGIMSNCALTKKPRVEFAEGLCRKR